MSKPLITIAGETREMNDTEFEQYKKDQADALNAIELEKQKLLAKKNAEAKLIALGLTKGDIEAIFE